MDQPDQLVTRRPEKPCCENESDFTAKNKKIPTAPVTLKSRSVTVRTFFAQVSSFEREGASEKKNHTVYIWYIVYNIHLENFRNCNGNIALLSQSKVVERRRFTTASRILNHWLHVGHAVYCKGDATWNGQGKEMGGVVAFHDCFLMSALMFPLESEDETNRFDSVSGKRQTSGNL